MKKLIILCSLFSFCAYAEVISSSENGFSLEISVKVNSSPKQAYKQFLQVKDWWNSEHTWFGNAKGLSIQPKVNGCFCEKNGNKQAVHMTVTYVDPNNEIRMIGGLGPLQAMGLHGGMTWTFEKLDETTTKITHKYNVTGYSKDGLKSLAPVVDSVQQIQVNSLANLLKQ